MNTNEDLRARLPELPKGVAPVHVYDASVGNKWAPPCTDYYTADQMRDYALAAIAPHSGGEDALLHGCYMAMQAAMNVIDVNEGPGMEHSRVVNALADCRIKIEQRNASRRLATPTPQSGEATQAHALAELREAMDIADPTEREALLVSFFRTTGAAMGRHGDAMGWTPEQTARHYLSEASK